MTRSSLARSSSLVVATASLVGLVATFVVSDPTVMAVTCAFTIAAFAAVVDVRTGLVLDRHVLAVLAPPVVASGLAATDGALGMPAASFAGAVVYSLPLLAAHLASPTSLGFGDVKLAAALGAALGLADPLLGVVALCCASGLTLVAAIVWRRRAMPFGPGLVVGGLLALSLDLGLGGVW